MSHIEIPAIESARSVTANIRALAQGGIPATNPVVETILSRTAAKYYDPSVTLSDDPDYEMQRAEFSDEPRKRSMTTLTPATADTASPESIAASHTSDTLDRQLRALRQRLLRQARLAMPDAGEAEDLVQETLLVVFEQQDQHRGTASLATWSTSILKNKIADWYRSPARRRMVLMDTPDEGSASDVDPMYDASGAYADPVPAWQQPDNLSEQREMMTVLGRCVSCLPRQTGRVFMMREWLGFETAEICARLGLTAENCRTIMHRGRMSLRGCMQRDWLNAKAAV